MREHYPKSTRATQHWCNACGKLTWWRVLGGQLAFCIHCYDHPKPKPPAKLPPLPEPTLF